MVTEGGYIAEDIYRAATLAILQRFEARLLRLDGKGFDVHAHEPQTLLDTMMVLERLHREFVKEKGGT